MEVHKAKQPMKDETTGKYFYPQTVASLVGMEDGTTLDEFLKTVGDRLAVPKIAYNLLDNSDFTNPVNQRGATNGNYSWEYAIDRWMFNGTGFTINANGITIPAGGSIVQRLVAGLTENDDNKIFVVCLGDGTILSSYGNTTVNNVQIYKSKGDNFCGVRVNNLSSVAVTVKWVALYEGENTAETLPVYIPKGYAHELLECQRYYQRLNAEKRNWISYDAIVRSTGVVVLHNIPISPMRAVPQCTYKSNETIQLRLALGGGNAYGTTSSTTIDGVFEINYSINGSRIGIQFNVVNTGTLGDRCIALIGYNGSSYLELSADL